MVYLALKCNLKIVMIQKGIKQYELANKTRISRSNINLIANGKQDPSLENAMIISEALGVSVYDIWERV